jgi:hypothetical protein
MSPRPFSRRRLLQLAGAAATLGAPAFAGARSQVVGRLAQDAPRIAFLGRDAGARALADAPDDAYYARMGLLEIRARMHSPLAGLSLAEARAAVRDFDAAAVLDFTDEERAAITGVVERMQPLLAARAPLYARTPWSFIHLDDRAEGGMPHTRGPHIVLPKAAVAAYVKMQREASAAGTLATTPRGRGLLIHEQTHVLERADPRRFEPLFTDVFGFTRMTPAPASPWLDAHVCTNPDGPDLVWAFALDQVGGSGWVMPAVTLPDVAVPRMPQDFQSIAIELARSGSGWTMVEADGVPTWRDLDQLAGWHAHFPFPDEDFHPNEIAAVALSHWILRDVPDLDGRPRMPAVAAWAKAALA